MAEQPIRPATDTDPEGNPIRQQTVPGTTASAVGAGNGGVPGGGEAGGIRSYTPPADAIYPGPGSAGAGPDLSLGGRGDVTPYPFEDSVGPDPEPASGMVTGGDTLIRAAAMAIQLMRAWETHNGGSALFESVAEAWGVPVELAHAMFGNALGYDPLAHLVAARDAPENARKAEEAEAERRRLAGEAANRPFGLAVGDGKRTTW